MEKNKAAIIISLIFILTLFLDRNESLQAVQGLIPAADHPLPSWTHLSTINNDLPLPTASIQQVSTLVIDIDKDGLNDFVIGARNGDGPSLVWYQRTADGWQRHVIDQEALDLEAGGHFHDIDQDGDLDIAMGGNTSNQVWWWENPYPDYQPAQNWTRRVIKDSGLKKHHDLLFGDFDNDAQVELVFWNQRARKLFLADIPADPHTAGEWARTEIYSWETEDEHEGLAAADVDMDGLPDIIGGGRWFKYNGAGFDPHIIDIEQEMAKTAVGQLIPGGAPEIIFVIGDGVGPLKWYELVGQNWVGHDLLGFDVWAAHSIEIGDIDLDGNQDIFAAQVRSAAGNEGTKMWAFFGDGLGNFNKVVLQSGYGNHESRLADLDGDCDLDILGKPFDWQTPRLDIWINETPCPPIVAHNIPLDQGWNMISSNVIPTDPDLTALLAGLDSNLILLKNGSGEVFWPAWDVDTIGDWNVEDGYQIYITNAATLTIEGRQTDPAHIPIPLYGGSNMISFLPQTAWPADQALAGISDHLVMAKNGRGEIYWPEFGINQIVMMQPGHGYQLYLTQDSTLVFLQN